MSHHHHTVVSTLLLLAVTHSSYCHTPSCVSASASHTLAQPHTNKKNRTLRAEQPLWDQTVSANQSMSAAAEPCVRSMMVFRGTHTTPSSSHCMRLPCSQLTVLFCCSLLQPTCALHQHQTLPQQQQQHLNNNNTLTTTPQTNKQALASPRCWG